MHHSISSEVRKEKTASAIPQTLSILTEKNPVPSQQQSPRTEHEKHHMQ